VSLSTARNPPILRVVTHLRRILSAVVCLFLLAPLWADSARDIRELLDETGAVLEWDDFGRTGLIWSGLDSIGFTTGEPVAVLDFTQLVRIEPVVYDHGKLLVPHATFNLFAERLREGGAVRTVREVSAIVIDAGHGGHDGGASRTVTEGGRTVVIREKDIVLDLAMRVAAELRSMLNGPQIVLSRDTDVFLELSERTEIAHSLREDPLDNVLFVSIHANSSGLAWTDARGVEIYYLPATHRRQVLESATTTSLDPAVSSILNDLKEEEFTVESVLMGQYVLESINRQIPETPVERGIRPASFFVVREARMPSILIETGFVNNQDELALLRSEDYRQRMSEAIALGVAAYVNDFEHMQ
jgi:N-acetylmuramoyl-L-alanine amidase